MYMQNLMACFLLYKPKERWLKRVIAVVCREHWLQKWEQNQWLFLMLVLLSLCYYLSVFYVSSFFSCCVGTKQPGFTVTQSRVAALLCLMSHACPHTLPTCLPLWKMTLQGSFTAMGWQWHIDGLVAMTVKVESLICVFHLSWQVSLQHFIW